METRPVDTPNPSDISAWPRGERPRERLLERGAHALSDAELLRTRFCDLRLTLRHSEIEDRLREIRRSLKARGLKFRPHVWLSEEWFSPDGVPGIAVPV